MPKTIFTQDEVNDYLKGKKDHFFKVKATEMALEMAIHADGVFPVKLIRQRRPHEPLEVLLYREIIWTPITKPTIGKVFSSLQKIRRSRDWAIKYTDLDQYSKISDEENLESYCEKDFPYFTSLTNWVFSILLRKYLIDSNALIFVMPIDAVVEPNEYLRPFPEIYDSCFVVDFREEDYAILQNPTPITYYDGKEEKQGKSYYFVTTQSIFRYDQVDNDLGFKLVVDYQHGLGFLPVFKLGGVLLDQADRQFLFQSRIADMLPELNEAVREYSDLQAAKVLHIYPERWEYTNNECTVCKGTGRRPNPSWTNDCNCPHDLECAKCHGEGYVAAGPYSKIMVKPADSLNPGSQIPTPPAGYIQKDIAVVTTQQSGVDGHVYKALSAINFQFLEQTPLNQSGTAKEVDKDELNNTVNSIAEDIISIMDKTYKAIAYYRYKDLYSAEDIDDMLPDTTVPQVFDLLSTQNLEEELINSRKNNLNPVILNAMEIDYATKRFNDQTIRDMVALTLELDPLPNIQEADKVLMLQNEGITKVTYVISSNIQTFIQQAIDDNDNFVELDPSEQRAIITKMAQDQIDAVSAAKAIVQSAFLQNGGNGLNNNAASGALNTNQSNDDGNNIQPDNTGNLPIGGQIPPTDPRLAVGYIG